MVGANSRANMRCPLVVVRQVLVTLACDTTPRPRAVREAADAEIGAADARPAPARARAGRRARRSMEPTLRDGRPAARAPRRACPGAGALVVVRLPDGVVAVKRARPPATRRLVGGARQPRRGRGLLVRWARSPSADVVAVVWPARVAAGPERCACARREHRRARRHPRRAASTPHVATTAHEPPPARTTPAAPAPTTPSSPCTSAARWRSRSTVAARRPRRPLARLHAGRGAGLRGDRRGAGPRPTTTPGCPTPSRSSPTAPRSSGLGDIGPAAAMPVMEGKAVLFKQFGGVDAVPICLDTTDVDEIVETVVRLAPSFGGINLEDISAPRCFEIERAAQGAARHPGLPRRPARHGGRGARRAARTRCGSPGATLGDRAGRDLRRRRRRRRGDAGSCSRPASATSRSPTAAACCTPAAAT